MSSLKNTLGIYFSAWQNENQDYICVLFCKDYEPLRLEEVGVVEKVDG